MDLRGRLRAIVDPLPAGAAVTLPADILRTWLDEEASGPDAVDLTAVDVGALLRRAPSTIRTWCAAGRLPGAYRCRGREWRIPRAALRALRRDRELVDPEAPVDLGAWRRVSS
jgi:hypothetical protein